MNLRSFLYINPTLLDDYISAIDGFVYEEETLTTSKTKSVEGGLEGGIPVVKAKGNYTNTDTEEAQKQVKITNSAKFDKVYNYLEEQDNLKYYEYMEDAQWDEIKRNDFLEVKLYSILGLLSICSANFSIVTKPFSFNIL